MWESSNPALRNDNIFNEVYGRLAQRADTITLQGVLNKTGLLVLIAVAAGAGGYALAGTMPSIVWISCIAAFIAALGRDLDDFQRPAQVEVPQLVAAQPVQGRELIASQQEVDRRRKGPVAAEALRQRPAAIVSAAR